MNEQLIFSNQEARMDILLQPDAGEQESYAADELRRYLELMSAAPFTVTTERGPRSVIFIHKVEDKDLGADGFRLQTCGADLTVTGGKRGVIYGVYELLERFGCRFFAPDCERVPSLATLSLPDLDECQKPVLEYRAHNYWMYGKHTRFAVKSRLNGMVPIREKHGGHVDYVWFVHSFERMVPPERFAKDHPEYYALVNGERPTKYQRFQLCLSNPDVLRVSIDSVREALRENPGKKIISISQNDWGGNCECPDCKAADEREGSPAGILIDFLNAIAEELEPEFPDVVFDTLAYTYSRQAPRFARPRHNVCVRLCSIECCFAHSFEDCDDDSRSMVGPDGRKTRFADDLRDWGKICNRMYIWDYTTCFSHYPTPHPNWRNLQKNMRTFIKNNVKGVFEQACGASAGGVDLNELRAYVITKLLWDAQTDVDRHIREFTDEYYGAAGPLIREYINTLCDNAEHDNCHVGFNDSPLHSFLEEDMLDAYDAIFARAQAAVASDPLRLYRVAKAHLAPRYIRMKRRAMLQHVLDRDEINRFFTDWQSFGLTRIDEWVSWQTTHKALLRGLWRGTEFYEHWSDEGADEY